MPERIAIMIDLGPSAPVEVVSSAIARLSTICSFSTELEERSLRNRAIQALAEAGPGVKVVWQYLPRAEFQLSDDPSPHLRLQVVNDLFEQGNPYLLDEIESQIPSDVGQVYVERLIYSNPIDTVLVAATGAGYLLLKCLEIARDWKQTRRRQKLDNDYRERRGRLELDDFEDVVYARGQIRRALIDSIREGSIPLTAEQIDHLLTPNVSDAFLALGRADMSVRQLHDDDNTKDHHYDARDDEEPSSDIEGTVHPEE